MQTSPPPQKGFQGPNPITVTRTWGAVGRAAMQQTSAVCYFIFFPQDQAAAGGAAREQPTGWRKPSQPTSCFSALNPIKGGLGTTPPSLHCSPRAGMAQRARGEVNKLVLESSGPADSWHPGDAGMPEAQPAPAGSHSSPQLSKEGREKEKGRKRRWITPGRGRRSGVHSPARPVPGKGARQGGGCWAGGEGREGWVVQGNGDLAGELAAVGQWHSPLPGKGALLMGARWHCPSGPHRGSLRSEATSTAQSAG